jgi:hypothetical protein
VRGGRIVSLLGEPGQPPAEEARERRAMVEGALRALTVPVERPTLFA